MRYNSKSIPMLSIDSLLIEETNSIYNRDIRRVSKLNKNFYLRRYRISIRYNNLI